MGGKADRRIESFVKKVRKKVRLELALLFGSRAKGTHLETSDYDLILVSPDFRGKFFTSRAAELLDLWNYPYDLELFCYTPEEFEELKKRIGIVKTALKEGVRLKL